MRLTKKITVLLVFVAVLLAAPIIIFANDIRVSVDGEFVNFPDAQPTIVDIRTLVPVRAVFEKAGFYVGWDEDTKTAIITNETYTILITIGNATFYTNGISHLLDVPAQIIG
ncbi:MAG: copper amine oxidase N-terminal domain-containing protein, partial [Defluviitaleaceae bacterium]|nr:copper amine oxidase N-terminal domain-containing protein [Defluviitaleaceae bacterium]